MLRMSLSILVVALTVKKKKKNIKRKKHRAYLGNKLRCIVFLLAKVQSMAQCSQDSERSVEFLYTELVFSC